MTQQADAQKAVRQALKRGTLVRPETCEECDGALKSATPRALHAAHYNYNEPLRIRWLCASCHATWDALRKHVAPEHREKDLSQLFALVSAARRLQLVSQAIDTRTEGSKTAWGGGIFLKDILEPETLGQSIKNGRQALNLTQSQFSKQTGVSQGYVSKAESGSLISKTSAEYFLEIFAEAVPGVNLGGGSSVTFSEVMQKARGEASGDTNEAEAQED